MDLIASCNNIKDTANSHIDVLLPYGVTTVYMHDYELKIESYVSACAIPENAKLAKKEATRQIGIHLVAMDELLAKMDGAAFIIRNIQSLFYKKYLDARKLVDPPTFMLAARGKIVNEVGEAIPCVNVSCKGLGINRRTTKNGGFNIKNAAEGTYEITFTYPGYKTVTKTFSIAYGSRAEILVMMELLDEI